MSLLEREMGFTHREFMQILPSALRGYSYEIVHPHQIHIHMAEHRISIHIGEQQIRKIGLLELPYLPIRFDYPGLPTTDWQRFLTQFDLYYRKGGG